MSASWFLESVETSIPSSRYRPLVSRSRQPMMFIIVDLPEPDGPITATNSPLRTSNDTPRNAWTSTSPVLYVLWASSIRMTAGFVAELNGHLLEFLLRSRRHPACRTLNRLPDAGHHSW